MGRFTTPSMFLKLLVIRYNITLQNNGHGMMNKFDFSVEPDVRECLAYLEVSMVDSSIKSYLKVTEIEEDRFKGIMS